MWRICVVADCRTLTEQHRCHRHQAEYLDLIRNGDTERDAEFWLDALNWRKDLETARNHGLTVTQGDEAE